MCIEIESVCVCVCVWRERSRVVKIKNIKKQNLLYGCFKKQSTQKISSQKMKLKERDKSILEYVQCMYNNNVQCCFTFRVNNAVALSVNFESIYIQLVLFAIYIESIVVQA